MLQDPLIESASWLFQAPWQNIKRETHQGHVGEQGGKNIRQNDLWPIFSQAAQNREVFIDKLLIGDFRILH